MITQEELKRILDYDEYSGLFTRKIKTSNSVTIGEVAGCLDECGYTRIRCFGKTYKAHRLAWLYVYGEFPDIIDHINGIKNDNRISNLREATVAQNNMNTKRRKDNTSGYKGVSFIKAIGKWGARIRSDKSLTHLGVFDNIEDAAIVYREASLKYHGEFVRVD